MSSRMLPDTKKSLGQHWLQDQSVLQSICEAGRLSSNDTVLEIGPGPGVLTALLVKQAKRVIAVELDSTLARELPKRVLANNLEVVTQDILQFNLTTLPADYVVVANIPYYITSKLIRVLSETPNQPKRAIILVQKEVAERVAGQPGTLSLLSVSAQYYWNVSLGDVVPARLFVPSPKVDSQVLIMERRAVPVFSEHIDTKLFFVLVKAGFSARRKTLQNSLSGGLRISREAAGKLLQQAQLSPTARPQELRLEDWYQLYVRYANFESKTT